MKSVITFYSYKGGVGRTMALANTATLLAKWKFKVLILDWDLEAPGLENFFKKNISNFQKIKNKEGLIDILLSLYDDSDKVKWQNCISPIKIGAEYEVIHLITAGKRDVHYPDKLRKFNVGEFYNERNGGLKLEELREDFLEKYDFVLIDSRTGVTDFGGICTIHLPDILVLLFTPTDQSLTGIKNVAIKAVSQQINIPFDRQKLLTVPIPTRIDSSTEFEITRKWISKFSKELKNLFSDWLPKAIDLKEFIDHIKIPYIPFFSYGEELATLGDNIKDPSGLGYAYETLSSLLMNNLQNPELLLSSREYYINKGINFDSNPEFESKKGKIKIHISYSRTDRKYFEELRSFLSVLESKYNVETWSDINIKAGDNWSRALEKQISESDFNLIILSPDFLGSDYLNSELDLILGLSQRKVIVPIIARQTNFENHPLFEYQHIPKQPIENYKIKDEAYKEIYSSIEKLIINHNLKKEAKQLSNVQLERINTNELKSLISEGNLKEVNNQLREYFSSNKGIKNLENELIILLSRYSRLEKDKKAGLIDRSSYNHELSRINLYYLNLIDQLDEYTTRNNG